MDAEKVHALGRALGVLLAISIRSAFF